MTIIKMMMTMEMTVPQDCCWGVRGLKTAGANVGSGGEKEEVLGFGFWVLGGMGAWNTGGTKGGGAGLLGAGGVNGGGTNVGGAICGTAVGAGGVGGVGSPGGSSGSGVARESIRAV